ncbi:MAG: DUF4127 family protein [Negativicutes bacterium]
MFRRFIMYLALIFFLTGSALSVLFIQGYSLAAVPSPIIEVAPRGVILVVPLDSRPPCTDYLVSLARMAGFKVILPPSELMDEYQKPANVVHMREWLQQNIILADAAIISVDMLIHGGLLASRKGTGSKDDATEVLALLDTIHKKHPQVKLFAFSIIPRLLIPENPHTEKYRQPMVEWSMLQETTTLFENPKDFARLQRLEAEIPVEIINRYRALYAANHQLNRRLVTLAQNGVLSGLVLGQDDSAIFGLGNLERQRLENQIGRLPEMRKKIFVTRGTDEVALTLLGPVTYSANEAKYKVFIHYTEAHTTNAILPYMPRPLMQTVTEKLAISGAEPTSSISEADFILVVHAGNSQSREAQMKTNADQIKFWMEQGHNVAVVDLATDWIEKQTLLPYLQRNETPLYQLRAYAGWNTASNSIGTAITQSIMTLRGHDATVASSALYRDLARVEFLSDRILDDWYYQKILRHQLNEKLERQKIDPYNLKDARKQIANQIHHQLFNAHLQYIRRSWHNAVIPLYPPVYGSYALYKGTLQASLPWERTFEIFVDSKFYPAKLLSGDSTM